MVTLAAEAPMILPEAGLIVRDTPLAELLRDRRRMVFVCGPGLGRSSAAKLAQLIAAGDRKIVVDADALTACAGAPERLRGAAVITPHEGEFSACLRAARAGPADGGARRRPDHRRRHRAEGGGYGHRRT